MAHRLAAAFDTVLLNNIRATNPDAVVHLGYAPNDIAFLRNVQDSGIKFKFLFCIYPGLETELLEKNVGGKGMNYVFTYVPSSEISYETNFGMSLKDYSVAWHNKYANTQVEFGFNSVAGYTTGLVLEKALATTDSLDQLVAPGSRGLSCKGREQRPADATPPRFTSSKVNVT